MDRIRNAIVSSVWLRVSVLAVVTFGVILLVTAALAGNSCIEESKSQLSLSHKDAKALCRLGGDEFIASAALRAADELKEEARKGAEDAENRFGGLGNLVVLSLLLTLAMGSWIRNKWREKRFGSEDAV